MKIPIVDENDNLLYYKEPEERDAHGEITRSVGIWIKNEKGEILIAKRSKNKANFPNVWGLSAGGGVDEDESYEAAIRRETKEEIGIDLEKIKFGRKERMSDNQEFFNQYFSSQISSDAKFILQKSEVDEARWISLEELKTWYSGSPEEFMPLFDIYLKAISNYDNKN